MGINWSDKELIELCLNGKDTGYTMLYNKYASSIYHSIYRLVSDTEESEDLLQEVFVSVFSNVEKLVGIESFEAWTRRVAINASISHLRKRKLFFADIDTVKGHEIVDEVDDIEWLENQIQDIQLAIEKLPDVTKTIVNLFLFEDLSQEEIAKTLGMSHTAVRSQYHRAKNKIAESVKGKMCYER